MTKKKSIKLNVDLKNYLDKNLARDNLNLIKQLEKANTKIELLENQLAELPDIKNLTKELKKELVTKNNNLEKIVDKFRNIYSELDIVNIKHVKTELLKLTKIEKLPWPKAVDILYEILNSEDGHISYVLDAFHHIQELYPLLQNFVDEYTDE